MALDHAFIRREISDMTEACCNSTLMTVEKPFPTNDDTPTNTVEAPTDDDDGRPGWAIALIVIAVILVIIVVVLVVFIVLMKTNK